MHGGTAWVYDGVVTWMGIVGALKGFNMRGGVGVLARDRHGRPAVMVTLCTMSSNKGEIYRLIFLSVVIEMATRSQHHVGGIGGPE
jgi:hypothetical protein